GWAPAVPGTSRCIRRGWSNSHEEVAMLRLMWIVAAAAVVIPAATGLAQSAGRASPAALASARSKENAMREDNGPESVTLNADEMASLVEANLDREARRALDSVRVRLGAGRLTL